MYVDTNHAESCKRESQRVSVQRVTVSHIRIRVTTSHTNRRDVHPHNHNQNIPSPPSMNPDPVPPVRPLLTHVIADEPLRREAGPTYYFLTWPLGRSPECASW